MCMCVSVYECVVVVVWYLVGHHAHLRHLVLRCLPVCLGSRLRLVSSSRHDGWIEEE